MSGASYLHLIRQEIAPSWVRCANCQRERLWRDIFWHTHDAVFYCADVLACEARYVVQSEREDRTRSGERNT
jgi:hypothetical protein